MKTDNKFTFIEMLIVLGLIAFLMAMLIPALTGASEMAKKAFCINNLNHTVKIANMYNLDYGNAPYSSKYGIMECPDTDDVVNCSGALIGGTSYHYMGSRNDWEKNNLASGDGGIYGPDATNPSIMAKISDRDEKIVYDKSDTVHLASTSDTWGRFDRDNIQIR